MQSDSRIENKIFLEEKILKSISLRPGRWAVFLVFPGDAFPILIDKVYIGVNQGQVWRFPFGDGSLNLLDFPRVDDVIGAEEVYPFTVACLYAGIRVGAYPLVCSSFENDAAKTGAMRVKKPLGNTECIVSRAVVDENQLKLRVSLRTDGGETSFYNLAVVISGDCHAYEGNVHGVSAKSRLVRPEFGSMNIVLLLCFDHQHILHDQILQIRSIEHVQRIRR